MSDILDRSVFAAHKKIVGVLAVAGWLIGFPAVHAEEPGKQIFQQACAACHSIGGGRGVGPDLAGVTEKRPEEWLIRYIKSQDAVLKSGDQTAQALFDEYKMPMPDQSLSEAQVKAVLAHIKAAGSAEGAAHDKAGSAATAQRNPTKQLTADDIRLGQRLFEGSVRFANGGPACNACHNVDHAAVVGGGIIARDLTVSYSRMGPQGIEAMMVNAPFPVMQVAYEGRALNAGEVQALVGFLQQADKEHAAHEPRHYGWRMFAAAAGGVIVLLAFFSLIGRRRKRRSVNQAIYDRQVKSE